MISDDNSINACNKKQLYQYQNGLHKENSSSFYQGIYSHEQSDLNINQIEKKSQTPQGQQCYDSFSQRLIQFDQDNFQSKTNGQASSSNFIGKIQERRHMSYVKTRMGRYSEEDLPTNQLKHQSFLRKVFNKVKISLKVKAFINKMMSLTQIQKYRVFNENPIFFHLINDKATYQSKQLLQGKIGQDRDNSMQKILNSKEQQTQKPQRSVIQNLFKKNKRIKQGLDGIMNIIPVFSAFSQFHFVWDQIQLICLGFFFIIIPLVISFESGIVIIEQSWLVHVFLMVLLFMDIIFNFNTSLFQQGKEIKSRTIIAQSYLKNQFTVDVITFLCVLVFFSMQNSPKYEKYGQIFNACSIVFFLRYKQFGRVLKKIEMQYHFSPRISQILRLTNLFLTNIYIIHLLACVWIVIAKIQDDQSKTWLHLNDIMNESWYIQYLNAFYFNTVTMVTVGYGDMSPQTNFERMFSVLTVLSACGVFAYSISEVGSIFQEMNQSLKQRKNNLFVINNYMKKKKITSDLQYQIRHYLEYYWNESLSEDSQKELDIISQLSNNLKENLMIEANKILVAESPFFRDNFSFKTILKTVSLVQEQRCTPEEIIYLEGDQEECSIYFIEKGSVQVFRNHTNQTILFQKEFMECSTLKAGQYFGEVSFFTGAQRRFCVRSLEFTTLIKIERAKFIETIKEVPSDYERFCQIKDDIVYNKNLTHTMQKCCYCQHVQSEKAYHCPKECPIVHYAPNHLKLLDQFKYNNSLSQVERSFTKRHSKKHYNTLGRIEQVKGYQDRLAFQEESAIYSYIYTYGIQDFLKNSQNSDNQIIQSGSSLSSGSSDEDNRQENNDNFFKQKQIDSKEQILEGQDSSFSSEEQDSSEQSLSSPEKERSFQNYIKSQKNNHQINKNIKKESKSLIILEDNHESESFQVNLSSNVSKQIQQQDKTDDMINALDIEEQPRDWKSSSLIQEKLANYSTFIHNQMPSTSAKDISKNQNNISNQDKQQMDQQKQTSLKSFNLKKKPKELNTNLFSGQSNQKQTNHSDNSYEGFSSTFINLSPVQQKKPKSSILQSVKFKLPKKQHSQKNRSLQDLSQYNQSQKKGIKRIKSSGNNVIDKTSHLSLKQISPLKIPHHLSENLISLSSQQKNQVHKLKRFSSSGYVIQNSELFLNSTQDIQEPALVSQKQLSIQSILQQRLSTQIDNLVNNFQKIQEYLVNQSHTNIHNKVSIQQNLNNNLSMKEFDKMKILEIYFPHNNYDEVIFQQNQLQMNKSSKSKIKNLLAFSPSRRLQQNKYGAQQQYSIQQNCQAQVIKEMLNQNTLNRIKYLKNENNKKNSITDQLLLSQLSFKRRCESNQSLPAEKTDQLSPGSNQYFLTQVNQDDDLNKSCQRSQYDRKCSIEIGNNCKTNSHNLIIPNYFGLQKQPESQSSVLGKKSKFSNRNSLFKNEQISGDNSYNSQEKLQ